MRQPLQELKKSGYQKIFMISDIRMLLIHCSHT